MGFFFLRVCNFVYSTIFFPISVFKTYKVTAVVLGTSYNKKKTFQI